MKSREVISTVAMLTNIGVQEIKGHRKLRKIVTARKACVEILREQYYFSFPEIANAMGMTSHSGAKYLYDSATAESVDLARRASARLACCVSE